MTTSHEIHSPDDWRTQVRVRVEGSKYEVIREDRRNNTEEVIASHTHGEPQLVNYTDYVIACPWPHKGESCGWCSI